MYGLIIFALISLTIGGINTENVEVVPVDLNSASNSRYLGNFSRPLETSDIIQICGKIQPNGKYVIINLMSTKNGTTEVVLDLILWGNGSAIVTHAAAENSTWNTTSGGDFSVNIVVLEDKFKIAINGKKFTTYYHGTTIADINMIAIDRYIDRVTYIAQITLLPNINPNCVNSNCKDITNIPYRTYFPSMLKPGQIISITGTPTGSTKGSFSIHFTGNNVEKVSMIFC